MTPNPATTWVSIVLTMLIAVGVVGFVAGFLAYGNWSHRYRRQRAEAAAMVRLPDRAAEQDTVRARWVSERTPAPVVNVYLATPSWATTPLPPPRPTPVIDAHVFDELPAGWS